MNHDVPNYFYDMPIDIQNKIFGFYASKIQSFFRCRSFILYIIPRITRILHSNVITPFTYINTTILEMCSSFFIANYKSLQPSLFLKILKKHRFYFIWPYIFKKLWISIVNFNFNNYNISLDETLNLYFRTKKCWFIISPWIIPSEVLKYKNTMICEQTPLEWRIDHLYLPSLYYHYCFSIENPDNKNSLYFNKNRKSWKHCKNLHSCISCKKIIVSSLSSWL